MTVKSLRIFHFTCQKLIIDSLKVFSLVIGQMKHFHLANKDEANFLQEDVEIECVNWLD